MLLLFLACVLTINSSSHAVLTIACKSYEGDVLTLWKKFKQLFDAKGKLHNSNMSEIEELIASWVEKKRNHCKEDYKNK